MKAILPTRALGLFVGICILDLIVTAVLHAHGLIVEMNPLMKGFIEQSEWLFALVKGMTIIAGWAAMAWYAKANLKFVRKASFYGAAVYVAVWLGWFLLPVVAQNGG